MKTKLQGLFFVAMLLGPALGRASDLDEFKIKRQEVYAFSEPPTITQDGDRVTISFTSRGYCDVTVAVENANGKIVRHLASGVLGKNAPAPFQPDSLKQVLKWDGKDDGGHYIEGKESHSIRVSLGLKPRLERTLSWTPYKRITNARPLIAACPEGVLVYEGQLYDSVRLFGHDGQYLRTVYPFPADKVKSITDLHWKTFPQDGARLPAKEWFRQGTLLTSGTNSNHPFRGFGEQRKAHDGHGSNSDHRAASAMAVRKGRIALAMLRLNRLATDGSTGGLKLNGPKLTFEAKRGGRSYMGANDTIDVTPSSAAFSPDGKWLYLTGYSWVANFGTGGKKNFFLHGVVRIDFEGDGKPEVFAGKMTQKDEGTDDAHFSVPLSVACDSKGRVYVADYMNNRIQVFHPDGKLFKSLKVFKPVQVVIHQRTDEVFAFSWMVSNERLQKTKEEVPARLISMGTVEAPRKPVSYPFPLIRYGTKAGSWSAGRSYTAELDTWAKEPTVWLYPGNNVVIGHSGYTGHAGKQPYWVTTGIQIMTLKDGKLVRKHDFGRLAAKAVLKSSRVDGTNRHLAVNHQTGDLYVSDGTSTIGFSRSLSVKIEPDTGKGKLIHLPFDTEQMQFDLDGLAYLRGKGVIVRYDPKDWREVPWDYGEERKSVGVATTQATGPGKKTAKNVVSALVFPFDDHAPNGGFSISPQGNLVVPIKGGESDVDGAIFKKKTEAKAVEEVKKYQPKLYPGRSVNGLVMVYDRHGKIVHEDAIPGLTFTHGIKIDKDNNLYAMALATRVLDGKPYFNPATSTLIKFKPQKARIVGTYKKIPVPLKDGARPKRSPDMISGGKPGLGRGWVSGAEWFYGGVGYNGEHYKNPDFGCDCVHSSFDLDYFARSFVPEVGHCSVAVLDSNGNLILRVGTYGNVEDGKPLIAEGGPPQARSIGGDEVALFYAPHLATHTDRRLFIADVGNERILSVKLDYHESKKIPLKP